MHFALKRASRGSDSCAGPEIGFEDTLTGQPGKTATDIRH
jgi:hypothetical protein